MNASEPRSVDAGAAGLRLSVALLVTFVAVVGTAGAVTAQTSSAAAAGSSHQQAAGNNASNASGNFSLDADVVGTCGDRCRIVSANLTNTGNETAHNVTTVTNITAGNAQIWQQTELVGNLSVNESVERTTRVRISYLDAVRIVNNDGRIDINATVYSASGNETFTERRRVL